MPLSGCFKVIEMKKIANFQKCSVGLILS